MQANIRNIAYTDDPPSAQIVGDARRSLSVRRLLLGILLLAVGLRIVSALFQGNSVEPLPGIHDQLSYDELARRLLGGYGFSFADAHWPATQAGAPTAHWSYLYTLYLSGVYLVSGAQPLIARLLQAALAGLLQTWLMWRIGSRIFGPTAGLLAALFSAIYLYFVYYAGALVTESFYIVGILWTLDVALRLLSPPAIQADTDTTTARRAWRTWVELGAAIAVTVLLRQLFLLVVPFIYLWLWIGLHTRAEKWWSANTVRATPSPNGESTRSALHPMRTFTGLALATLVVICAILPWTVRNYYAFGRVVPLNTNAGYAFFWGNHPYYGAHFVGILPDDGPSYLDLLPRDLLHLNEAELDAALLKEGLGFVIVDPIRYVRLSLSRSLEYFKFWPTAESGLISNIARVGSFGLMLPLILYGLWVSAPLARRPRDADRQADHQTARNRQWSIALLFLVVAVYTAVHLLVWALIRYRLPIDSLLLIFAAAGCRHLMHSVWPNRTWWDVQRVVSFEQSSRMEGNLSR